MVADTALGAREMPLIECTLIKGYDSNTRRIIAERITDAACSAIGAAPEFVTVTINEVAADNYMRGRTGRTPATAPMQASDVVRAYLTAMENRQLGEAKTYLADGFVMTFPGGVTFTQLEELIEWTKPRYQSIAKTFGGFDVAYHGLGAVVHCHGTLNGIWPDGSTFENIRFADRFSLSGTKITSQQVWNDLAEANR